MHSPGINGEGELRGQPATPGSPGKMAIKMECVCDIFSSTGEMLAEGSHVLGLNTEHEIVACCCIRQ